MKQQVKINKVKGNPSNPRIIKNDKFKKLVQSIKEFPEMLKLRPIIVDEDFMVLGGNMRLKASKDAGLSEVWIDVAEGLTEEQKKEFIVKDNLSFGNWDWDILANEWDNTNLGDWGMDVWQPEEEVDYSILDDNDIDGVLDDMESGVKKAIQIPFNLEHYEEATELYKKLREKKVYVGLLLLELLRENNK